MNQTNFCLIVVDFVSFNVVSYLFVSVKTVKQIQKELHVLWVMLDALLVVDVSIDSASEPKSTIPFMCCSRDATGTCLDSQSTMAR